MYAVFRKALADLRGRPWQSALIAITVAAAATLLYLGLVSLTTVSAPYEKLMERTRSAHAYLLLVGPDGGRELAAKLAAGPGVTESDLRPVYLTTLKLDGPGRSSEVTITAVPPGQPSMMGYVPVDGRGLQEGDRGAAVLAVSVARFYGLSVGQTLQVATPDGVRPLSIVGLHADPMWCAFPTCDLQNVFVLPQTLADLTGTQETGQAMLGIRLQDPANAQEVVAMAHREAGQTRIQTGWGWQDVYTGIRLLQGLSVLSVLLFAVVAIFASALITANIIGGAVLGQYREIAVLKVLGMTRAQVLALFAGQNLLLGLAGGAAGVAAGHAVTLRALRSLAETTGNPDVLRFQPGIALAVMGLVFAISGTFAVLAAWRAVILRPAGALQEGFALPSARSGLLVRCLTALRLPAPVLLGVQDALARPGRAAMTVISVCLCLITIAMSAGIAGLVARMQSDPTSMGVPYDLSVGGRSEMIVAAEQILSPSPDVETYCRVAQVTALAVDSGVSFTLRGLDDGRKGLPFAVLKGRLPEGPGEVALAPGAMERTGAKVGGRLRVRAGGGEAELIVVGEYRDPINLGLMAIIRLDALQQISPATRIGGLMVRLRPGADQEALRQQVLRATDHLASVTLMRSFLMPPPLADLAGRMRMLSALMAGIAVLSLLNSALLTAREQMREVGIRKAVGMTPLQILCAVGTGGAWLGLVGAAAGIPAGLWLNSIVAGTVSENYGFGALNVGLTVGQSLLLTLGGALLAALASMPAAVWAGRLATAQVLTYE